MLNYSNPITEQKSYSGLQLKEINPIMKLIVRGKKREFFSAIGKSLDILLFSDSIFESFNSIFLMIESSWKAHATTGPIKEPLPPSSIPTVNSSFSNTSILK